MRRILKGLGWLGLGTLGLLALLLLLGRTPDRTVAELRARYASPASQFLEVKPGVTVHVRDEGPRAGRPVLLMHGSNASLHTFEPWVLRLSAAGYRVITLDLPAHGLSGPVPDRDYSYAAYVGVVEALVAQLGLERIAIGGNSMGGGVAWFWAAKHPEQLAALILVDSVGQPPPEETSPPLGFTLAKSAAARWVMENVTPRFLIERSLRQSVSVKEIVTPSMVDRYWELLLRPGTRGATLDRFGQYAPMPSGDALRGVNPCAFSRCQRRRRQRPALKGADWPQPIKRTTQPVNDTAKQGIAHPGIASHAFADDHRAGADIA